MTTMTTLGTVMERVERLSARCYDRSIKTSDILFDSLEQVDLAGIKHHLSPHAQQAFASRLGIPFQYLRKCPENIQQTNLNHWLRSEKNERLLFRFNGDSVRAVLSPRYVPANNIDILERLMDQPGYSSDTTVHGSVDVNFLCLNIPDSSRSFTVNGWDKLTPGISITNSEIGNASLTYASFILRIACSNGLISLDEMSVSFRHVSTKILQGFPQVLNNIGKGLDKQKHQLQISLETKIENLQSTIDRLSLQFQLCQQEKESVAWAIPLESGEEDPTMFSVVNIFTRSAQFPGLAADTSYKLQRCGGMILEMLK